jgi:uncharacterized membrane protein YvlD (DUF360 family)
MIKIIRQEPALIAGLVTAAVALVIAFGVKMSADQVGAITAAVGAVLAVIVRSQVTPVVPTVTLPVSPAPSAGNPPIPGA